MGTMTFTSGHVPPCEVRTVQVIILVYHWDLEIKKMHPMSHSYQREKLMFTPKADSFVNFLCNVDLQKAFVLLVVVLFEVTCVTVWALVSL